MGILILTCSPAVFWDSLFKCEKHFEVSGHATEVRTVISSLLLHFSVAASISKCWKWCWAIKGISVLQKKRRGESILQEKRRKKLWRTEKTHGRKEECMWEGRHRFQCRWGTVYWSGCSVPIPNNVNVLIGKSWAQYGRGHRFILGPK